MRNKNISPLNTSLKCYLTLYYTYNNIIEFILHLVIKLQRYEEALNDCNTVLTMDYKNVKALLRRALSLEHLEKAYEV